MAEDKYVPNLHGLVWTWGNTLNGLLARRREGRTVLHARFRKEFLPLSGAVKRLAREKLSLPRDAGWEEILRKTGNHVDMDEEECRRRSKRTRSIPVSKNLMSALEDLRFRITGRI